MIGNFQTSKSLNVRKRKYRCLCSYYVINTYASLMYELKKKLRVNLLGPGPSSYKKIIYRAAVSQRLGNTGLDIATHTSKCSVTFRTHCSIRLLKIVLLNFISTLFATRLWSVQCHEIILWYFLDQPFVRKNQIFNLLNSEMKKKPEKNCQNRT
jgi:hypothetical protein